MARGSMLLLSVLLLSLTSGEPLSPPARCALRAQAASFRGTCGPLFGQTPVFSLARTQSIRTGAYRAGTSPERVWAGDMTDEGYPNARVELEMFHDGTGILRTAYGWYPVSALRASARELQFRVDTVREVPPSNLDRAIIRRAAAILATSTTWNRKDNRQCPQKAHTWSLYCALERATREVTGGFHHRRPALQVVRSVVQERSAGKAYHHRLMDYNNDPATHIEDIQAVLAEALARMGADGSAGGASSV